MADKKISELDAISGSATASDDLFLIVDSSGSVTKKISREELNNAIEQDVLSTVDINGGTIDSTVIGGTTPAAGDFTTLGATGNITVGGTVDGRDVATDGTKLDGIAASATANPNAIDNVVEDTTPQLGGNLDLNNFNITGTGDIPSANLTGALPAIDGSALTGISTDLVGDTTPQLGGNLDLNSNDITGTGNIDVTGTVTAQALDLGTNNPRIRFDDSDTSNNGEITLDNSSLRIEADEDNAVADSKIYLRVDGSNKVAVDSTGVDVTGIVTMDGGSTSADFSFGDSDKAIFGAGSDLQIYHDGSASYIDDAGTGNLRVRANSSLSIQKYTGETMGVFTADGSVLLAYDNSTKLETTSGGIDVTGTVTADGLTVDGVATFNNNYVSFGDNGYIRSDASNELRLQSGTSGTNIRNSTNSKYISNFANNGDISFYADNGTTQGLFWDSSTQRLGLGTTSPSTALDVAGAVTADDVVISGANPTLTFFETDTTNLNTKFDNGGGDLYIQTVNDDGSSPKTRLLLDHATGDISFYADNGSTKGLHWDASTQRLGLGTTTPDRALHVNTSQDYVAKFSSSDVGAAILLEDSNSTANYNRIGVTTHDMQFVTNNAEAMRIASGGNVGIGTSSPDSYDASANNLVIYEAGNAGITIAGGTSNNGSIYFADGTSGDDPYRGAIQYQHSGNLMYFRTNSAERMRIDSSGNLLVGKTASDTGATAGLEFSGTYSQIRATTSGNPSIRLNRLSTDGTIAEFRKGGTVVGSVSVTGSGTTYNTTSDIRLKTDIEPIADATDKLMAMNAVTHKWKADPDADAVVGFIAQEMAEIVPEAVSKGDNEDDMWSMDYGRITPVLVAALQDAHKKIEQLEQRIAEMEAK